eukprot:jgi/Antlo1/2021/327
MAWFLLESREKIDLERTFFSGQIFSFKKTGTNLYSGVLNNAVITFRQDEDGVYYWFHKNIQNELASFFTLNISYVTLLETWNRTQNCVTFDYNGLRLLKCDLMETIFSFICSSNNNIRRITKMVDYLFSKGDFLERIGGHRFYSFPPVQRLVDIEEELEAQGFGYRARYICSAAKKLQKTTLDQNASYTDVCKTLMSLSGVGQKVADCICLIALGHLHVVPIDRHIFNVSCTMFGLKKKLDQKTCTVIKKRYLELFGSYAGIAQLFVFKDTLDRRPLRSTEAA